MYYAILFGSPEFVLINTLLCVVWRMFMYLEICRGEKNLLKISGTLVQQWDDNEDYENK